MWFAKLIAKLFAAGFAEKPALYTPDVNNAGQTAIATALAEWSRPVFDPRRVDMSTPAAFSKTAITKYIHEGLGWTWEPDYKGDGDFEWCGAFAAWCWAQAGLKLEWRKPFWASTYRLDRWARYQPFDAKTKNARPAQGPHRLIADLNEDSESLPFTPQPGDVLLIGPAGSGYGKHICLVESYANGVFSTIEGNGVGRSSDGQIRQGVVRGKRKLGGDGWHARRLIRPAPGDLG